MWLRAFSHIMPDMTKDLPSELRALVRKTTSILGQEIQTCFGKSCYQEVEAARKSMAILRSKNVETTLKDLRTWRKKFKSDSKERRFELAQSFALLMELTNVCENAYRSFRLESREWNFGGAEEIVFVVTAHPTEARNPATVRLFRQLQKLLKKALEKDYASVEDEIRFLVRILLKTPLAPLEKPTPQDEAEHLYRWILDEDLIKCLVDRKELRERVRFRAWVGGDKDGHPGVNESVMRDSLSLSRKEVLRFVRKCIDEAWELLRGVDSEWRREIESLKARTRDLERVSEGDEGRVLRFQADVERLYLDSQKRLNFEVPCLRRLTQVKCLFPMWLVPLEFRESSDVIEALAKAPSLRLGESDLELSIFNMLKSLRQICPGAGIRHYVQSWVISMVRDEHDLAYAEQLQRKAFDGELWLPIVPLLETRDALENASQIISRFLDLSPSYLKSLNSIWRGRYEVMLGYSDSAKESGVFASRVLISEAMNSLERLLLKRKLRPVFFHGTGGSIARGGGPVDEQMAWWPPSARKIFKVTIQGEMVARNFASQEHLLRYLSKIDESCRGLKKQSVNNWKRSKELDQVLSKFAQANANVYEAKVASEFFLQGVEKTTLYPFLHTLKIGSRPAKRKGLSKVQDLRAIPWVLYWTQARVLFPEWWGVVAAWKSLDLKEQSLFKKQALKDPLLTTYIKHLGFSLAKIELAPWFLSFDRLDPEPKKHLEPWKNEFQTNVAATRKLHAEWIGQRQPLWFRPWLSESIRLRKTMIFPLNILQDIALEESDENLLRLTVTGVASGMLTSG